MSRLNNFYMLIIIFILIIYLFFSSNFISCFILLVQQFLELFLQQIEVILKIRIIHHYKKFGYFQRLKLLKIVLETVENIQRLRWPSRTTIKNYVENVFLWPMQLLKKMLYFYRRLINIEVGYLEINFKVCKRWNKHFLYK